MTPLTLKAERDAALQEVARLAKINRDHVDSHNRLVIQGARDAERIAALEKLEPIYQACMNVGGLTYAWVDTDAEFYEAAKERKDLKTRIVYANQLEMSI